MKALKPDNMEKAMKESIQEQKKYSAKQEVVEGIAEELMGFVGIVDHIMEIRKNNRKWNKITKKLDKLIEEEKLKEKE